MCRADFNADNAKIDAALKAEADTRAAAVQSVSLVAAGKTQVAAGSYTGSGSETRTINTGFTPKAVLVFTESGQTYTSPIDTYLYGGLAVPGHPAGGSVNSAVQIVSGGFQVSYKVNNRVYISSNTSNTRYNYIAFG